MRFGFKPMASVMLSAFSSIAGFLVPLQPFWSTLPRKGSRGVSRRVRTGGRRRYTPNGPREVSRRLKQIAEGRLTASNGVV